MPRVNIVGDHPIARALRALVVADLDLGSGARAFWPAPFMVTVRLDLGLTTEVALDLGSVISPTEQIVLASLLRVRPHLLVRAGEGQPDGNAVVLSVGHGSAGGHELARALYRGLLIAAGVAPSRLDRRPSMWSRLRSRAKAGV
jgi:hypothetical protein